jgi:hypothetical protein
MGLDMQKLDAFMGRFLGDFGAAFPFNLLYQARP